MLISRRVFLMASGVTAMSSASLSTATPAAAKAKLWFTGIVRGHAAGGYDTVAYFTQGEAVPGRKDLTIDYDGARWRFSSEENRDLFLENPMAYAPQYGGYCAYATAKGYAAKGEPEVWRVIDGKLYLNYSRYVQSLWLQDVAGFIALADRNWPDSITG